MRKRIGTGILAVLMLAALTVPALAAGKPTDTNNAGMWDLKFAAAGSAPVETGTALENDSYKIEPLTASDAGITAADGFFAGAEKLRVTVKSATAAYYLITAQNEKAVPTAENLVYIDQKAGTDATFTIYPRELTADKTYYVYVTNNLATGEWSPIASFTYYAPYVLGDVDGKNGINPTDASLILQYCVNIIGDDDINLLAADVDLKGGISPTDASYILQYCVNIISDFSEVQN